MPKFNVLITEVLAGMLEVEAETEAEAWANVSRMIHDNEIPDGIMNETGGYRIEDVQAKL